MNLLTHPFPLRTLLLSSCMLAVSFSFAGSLDASAANKKDDYKTQRPEASKRCFRSEAVESTINQVAAGISDAKLAWMFTNCFPNTLDTTVDYELLDGKPDTYVITGDIDAMWLRDSSAQVWPYLSLANKDEALKNLFRGLISRQMKCILLDPYANAFYKDFSKETEWKEDKPTPGSGVHERKYEIDSYCYPIRLAYNYWKETGDASIFDKAWDQGARRIVKTFRTEQRKDGTTPYSFVRVYANHTVTAPFEGKGRPSKPVGLIASAFRPSDDGCMYPFLIPSNIFAAESLGQLAEIYQTVLHDDSMAAECKNFSEEVSAAINKYAVIDHLDFGKIYAYEVDGYGNAVFMDDPNIPSLIAMKYLNAPKYYDEEVYQNTRRYLLSTANPYYFVGKAGEGQGGPHAGLNTIWNMGIVLRAMTSTDTKEIKWCIEELLHTDADTGFMHETFNKDDASQFSRSWFAWANTLFGEMIVQVHHQHPELLKEIKN